MRPEILAPCGNFESLLAAVRNGADAVYFGTGNFNARRNASNFDGDELKKAIDFCHLHSVKCHVALNILVSDNELNEVIKTIECVCSLSADALILQDLGVAKLVKQICPDIELHASTQLSTGTLEGLKLLKDLGFNRAVLPRELSKSEIKYLCDNSPIELEMFVHGALCMSVSGQCLMSAMLGSRSGNRGLCAQPCRLPFKIENGTGNDLSLKDLSLIDEINELTEMGISSFKIEGRMKRPEYVAAAVIACRESVDKKYLQIRKNELESLFSRSGFTKGYYQNKLGKEMFGKREKENVTSATNELLKKYSHTFEKEKAVRIVDFIFTAYENETISLCATSDGKNVFVTSDVVCQKAINKPLTKEIITSQLQKCGGTVFCAGKIECDIDNDVSVPMSAINSLRREALEKLSLTLISDIEHEIQKNKITILPHSNSERKNYLCFYNEKSIPDDIEFDRLFLPIDCSNEIISKYNAGVIIPRGIFGNSEKIYEKLLNSTAKYALCNTLDAVAIARKAELEIIAGPFLNVFNSVSAEVLQQYGVTEITLSYELTASQVSNLGGSISRGAVVYGRTPLMLTRNCPVKNGKSCSECNKQSYITDRMGIDFPVICNNGFSEILNSRPTYMADRLNEIKNVDFIMLVFTNESKQESQQILNDYSNNQNPKGDFTRGLYYRGVE